MSEYAPEAISWLAKEITTAVPNVSGVVILGETRHLYGYHRARNVVSADDYSVVLREDNEGDGWAASALDVPLGPTWLRRMTRRLLEYRDDHRLCAVREFFGTTDGATVLGWDRYFRRPASASTAHLGVLHISFLRRYATDAAALAGVRSVLLGMSTVDPE
ncbi:hypothetical protein Afil01_55100 [Actinorhabdospora filicis]|uniref:Uncharacterized protein n=1 Tax=Actinorhabdospora filicis TaxID=1785913 RepID=A0A9W6SQX0_9ACTN|nr:hypothetical protein [Actinorhabdospora filicis]GLZ80703.1 hypothetical protein Afil01_55100 [Actinorhabdospora filicis]